MGYVPPSRKDLDHLEAWLRRRRRTRLVFYLVMMATMLAVMTACAASRLGLLRWVRVGREFGHAA